MENNPTAQPSRSPLGWIAFIVVVIVMGGAAFGALRENRQSNPQDPNQQQNTQPTGTAVAPLAPNTIVYGTWTNQSSEITAVDLSSRRASVVASLPITIKKVTVLSPETLMYIDETDTLDHGKKIKIYDVKTKKEKASISASPGFGFDDYVVSPNKQFVALWEVAFAEDVSAFQGGRSRVYAVKLSDPGTKRLLYDEVANTPVHYPRAVLDNGRVFTDKFQPSEENGGTGWAHGMGVVNFDGSDKQDLAQMQDGTYGTQPVLSPDGKFLVFAGYDGSKGPGDTIKNGYRLAIFSPNTVELLNTQTLAREKLANLANANIYKSAEWDKTSGGLIISVISRDENQDGLFSYNLSSHAATKITFPSGTQTLYKYLSLLSGEKMLMATTEDSSSSLGNLGNSYAKLINQLFVYDNTSQQTSSLRLENASLVQYITTLPQNYFQNVLGMQAYAQGGGNPEQPNVTIIDLYSDKPAQENLQLKTFLMKPQLAPVREEQQTEPPPPPKGVTPTPRPKKTGPLPRCRDLAAERCAELGRAGDLRCEGEQRMNGVMEGACYDSPLYLYGKTGEKIHVTVQTQVHNDTPSYTGGYNVTLQNGGVMQVNGQMYNSINYDYTSSLRMLKPPTKGSITTRSGIEKVLRTYAKKLGLNEKETTDLVQAGKKKVTSPYVFISFFDHETSTNILPLSFNPQPDNYLNVVFYFKLLDKKPNYTPASPEFGAPLQRTGLTAVEVSEIVE